MTMFRKVASIALTLALTAATGSPAIAQEIRRAASYHDLDLTRIAGVRELRRRVGKAVGYVCRETMVRDSLLGTQDLGCRQELMRQVEPQIAQAVETAERKADYMRLAAR
jgi:UrcA family protein